MASEHVNEPHNREAVEGISVSRRKTGEQKTCTKNFNYFAAS